MPLTKSTKITTSEAIQLIREAKNAELCRDIHTSHKILGAIWADLEDDPMLSGLETALQAEILRLCGFFLSFYGRSRNLKNFQERGRNFLTQAIEMFECENLPDKSAEAKVMLALCYWYEGAISECELILKETESEYENNQLHPVYIQICVNRLMTHYWKGVRYKDFEEFQKGLQIVENLATPIEFCSDLRLKAMYHNQAGIFYRSLEQTDKAIFHYNEAIKNARKSGNTRFVAVNLNNFAFLCKEIGDYTNAHYYVDESFKIFSELGEPGWTAHTLDTKGQIYFAENKLATALTRINEALEIFRQGEDFSGLVDSLFTKCKILLKLENVSESILLFAELIELAKLRIGEFASEKYADEFAKMVYPIKNAPYPEEVRSFKTNLLRRNLTDANLQITKASEKLGISHQNLSDILNNQFPELFEQLGIRRRMRRSANEKGKNLQSIAPVNLSRTEMFFDGGIKLKKKAVYYTFAMNGRRLPSLKTSKDVIVLIESLEKSPGAAVIMQNQENNNFLCGILETDKLTGFFYLNDPFSQDGFPLLFDDYKYYGKIVGYCPLEDSAGTKIVFRSF